jgi:hypothetical protein
MSTASSANSGALGTWVAGLPSGGLTKKDTSVARPPI